MIDLNIQTLINHAISLKLNNENCVPFPQALKSLLAAFTSSIHLDSKQKSYVNEIFDLFNNHTRAHEDYAFFEEQVRNA